MKIRKAFCFFEQSGTFRDAFRSLGIEAECYDIQNEFGQTDNIVDLFAEIETAYEGGGSVFDSISRDDLIIAFFPCIYFCDVSQLACTYDYVNYRTLSVREMTDKILEREHNREKFLSILLKMFAVAKERGLRLILENPWTGGTYLKTGFPPPSIVDMNRQLRGDVYAKPTAYWYVNCEPTHGCTLAKPKETATIRRAPRGKAAGICGTERSAISPVYARNFICDFVLGKSIAGTQEELFKEDK